MRAPTPLRTLALAVAIALVAARDARADRVFVRGGGVLEGEATHLEAERAWRVKLASGGEAVVPEADIERVESGATAHEEYVTRLAALDKTDADGHVKLGFFCQEHGLRPEAEALFRHAIAVVPGHEAAHAALGEVLYDGRWVPYEDALKAQGQVKMGARWVTPEERDRILREEAARSWAKEVRRLSYRARSVDEDTRRDAQSRLAAIDDPLALEALLEFARHWHAGVRVPCAIALCRFPRDERVAAELARLASRDDDLDARDAVIAALAEARIEAVGERLLADYIRSEEAWVRAAAAHALGGIHFKPAFYALVATLYFHVAREELVPTDGVGMLLGPAGAPGVFERRREVLRSYRLQTYEYRVVADVAFNDAARAALEKLTGRSFDFDRPEWEAWWRENEAKLDTWMRPLPPPAPPAPPK
jgi:hypothetical protein